MFSVFVIFLLFAQALAQDTDCVFSQNVVPGQTYLLASPADYSNGSYRPGRQCLWLAFCPSGYNCRIDCTLEMPSTSGCTRDQFLVSRSGDRYLVNADRYCGRQTLTSISINTTLSAGLISSPRSTGGFFQCTLRAQAVQQPTPQPCQCGIINRNRIVGGIPTGANEYPMMAGLIDNGTGLILCGGVIISDRYIMTAAHCVQDRSTRSIIISVGDRNLQAGIKYYVSAITIHPNFDPDNYDYDIALLRLVNAIVFTAYISPVCLPFKYQSADATGVLVDLLGWGTTFFGGPTSPVLLKTNSTIINQSECSRYQAVTPRQICTLKPGQDACQNDSGGPLIYIDNNGRAFTVGIVSYGNVCGGNSPGINTRVPVLLTWIMNNAPANYCVVP